MTWNKTAEVIRLRSAPDEHVISGLAIRSFVDVGESWPSRDERSSSGCIARRHMRGAPQHSRRPFCCQSGTSKTPQFPSNSVEQA